MTDTIEYHYLNMETKKLVQGDITLCKEVGHAGLTRSIPYFIEGKFCILIAGGKAFTEAEAIELFEELTGTVIPKETLPSSIADKDLPPDTSESPQV